MNWENISKIITNKISKINRFNTTGFDDVNLEIDKILTSNLFLRLDVGRNRAAYLSTKNNVIKIPVNKMGIDDNVLEYHRYKTQLFPFPMAKCKIIYNNILIMEYVNTDVSLKYLPPWTQHIDCGQVGYNKQGKLVAYDYAQSVY